MLIYVKVLFKIVFEKSIFIFYKREIKLDKKEKITTMLSIQWLLTLREFEYINFITCLSLAFLYNVHQMLIKILFLFILSYVQ